MSEGRSSPRAVLGVGASDGPDVVRRAYRRLVLECHPDRHPGPEAAARFAAVSDAYRAIRSEPLPPPPPAAAAPPPAAGGEPPILSWRNVESNLHFCLRGLGKLVRKAITPAAERDAGR